MILKINYFKIALMFLILLFGAGCTKSNKGKSNSIIATIYPYYLMAKELTAGRIECEVFFPPNASPHTFSPRPSDVKKFYNSKLIIANGLYLESKLTKILSKFKNKTLLMSDCLDINKFKEDKLHKHHSKVKHGMVNPHIWTDPVFLIRMVKCLVKRLNNIDPEGSKLYRKRSNELIKKLNKLHNFIKGELRNYRHTSIVTFHNAFHYFFIRYGINLVDVITDSPGKKPSPKQLVKLGVKIKKFNINSIFIEPQLNNKSAKVFANEFGLKIQLLDPIGNHTGANNIIDFIKFNWNEMKKGFE